MKRVFEAAWVIARRDFVATVYSRTFLFFLLAPLLFIGISFVSGNLAERMAREDMRATVAVVAAEAEFRAIDAARTRINSGFGESGLPDLVRAEPDYVPDRQVSELLSSRDKRILAVLTGGTARPRLTGALTETGSIRSQMVLIIEEARQQRALAGAGLSLPPLTVELVKVEESAGSRAKMRSATARIGQLFLFILTLMLATMLLSNLIEEKSSKVIEVLAAAVPIDAIFLGKLFSMLAISLVGIAVWAGTALAGLSVWPLGESLTEPAVGWPLFVILLFVYYSANFLLLGAVFLGIGSQASSIREVQTLSMPVSIAQILLFFFASIAVGAPDSLLGIAAAIFPYSSPMVMVARAAQSTELWPHLLAIGWQALWVWLTVKLSASLFRSNVMKSGGDSSAARSLFKRKELPALPKTPVAGA